MKKILFAALFICMSVTGALADTVSIKQFTIKENPFARQEIAIVATDTAGLVQENVSGKFAFTINGFDNELTFQSGTAFYRHKVQKSAFMYIKHKNEAGTHSGLYYIYKRGEKLTPLHISWMWLVAIPLIIVFAGYLFKRFIILAVIVLVILYTSTIVTG